MMTVPMDNGPAPASRELVQRLLKKNIELENKRRKSAQARIPSDPNAWQQMRENYETIILEDHDFSEQHEIEYALWQLHYRRIEELRAHFSAALASNGSAATQGGKSPARPDRVKKIRSQFKTFLSEATGFYHDLILKIRAKYGLPLDHFPEDVENLVIVEKDGKKSSEMKKGLLSCHRCLIYLGDLARYKGLYGEGDSKTRDYVAASSYYMQAASLLPSSGNPHHQLAILASYSGDELVAVYRYFRSLAVNCPFSTARDNLIIAFEKNRQNYSLLPGDANLSVVKSVPARKAGKGRGKGEKVFTEDLKLEVNSVKGATSINDTYKAFSVRFVRLNGILFTRTSLETLEEVFSLVISDLHLLLSSGPVEEMNFGSDSAENGLVIVRLIAILIFTVHNVNRETEGQSYAEILQRSVLLQNAFTAAFRFVGFILERCLQLQDPSSSFLLPGILVFIEWLACRPDVAVSNDAEEKQVTARSFFWKHCVSFLNKLVLSRFASNVDDEDENCFFNMSRYDESETGNRLALWEDFELRGFLPLVPAQLILDFSRKHTNGSDGGSKEKRARVQRILAAGRALTNIVQIDQKGICFDQKLKKFTIGYEPQISDITSANGMPQESPVDKIKIVQVLPPKEQVHAEGEEEDEVIVFKPTVLDKLGDVIAPKLATCEGLGHVEKASKAEWESYVGPISTSLSSSGPQNVFDASNPALASLADKLPQQLQPMNPVSSTWLMEQENSFSNGIKNISIYGNGLTMSSSLQDGFGSSQPPAFSLPVPHSAKLATGFILPNQSLALETEIPSKFDSIMSLGTTAESLTTKPLIASSTSLRKNPVSRPARHHGPPPGFSPLPPKAGDELMVGSDMKHDNPPVDDYSWLDGYQLPSSTKGMAVSNSVNHVTPVYPHVMSNSSSLTDTINFPFPGKQAPSMQVQGENQKTWQDYQLLEHLKLYQEQQPQLQQAHQWSAPLPEQYQGQTLWPGRFFV